MECYYTYNNNDDLHDFSDVSFKCDVIYDAAADYITILYNIIFTFFKIFFACFIYCVITHVVRLSNSQGGYPAKLKKVLIVTAPLWFKAPFKILRLFVREKLRDRVFTISLPQVRET